MLPDHERQRKREAAAEMAQPDAPSSACAKCHPYFMCHFRKWLTTFVTAAMTSSTSPFVMAGKIGRLIIRS